MKIYNLKGINFIKYEHCGTVKFQNLDDITRFEKYESKVSYYTRNGYWYMTDIKWEELEELFDNNTSFGVPVILTKKEGFSVDEQV